MSTHCVPDTDCFKPISNIGLAETANSSFINVNDDGVVEGNTPGGQKKVVKGGRQTLFIPKERPMIRIRTLAQGLLLAEQWGLHIDSLKPWEKKTRVLPYLSPEKMKPIDQEDAYIYGKGDKPVMSYGIAVVTITPENKAQCDAANLNVPEAGTVIEIDGEVAKEMARKIAEQKSENPRSGDKVAALSALLGNTIATTMGKTWKGQAGAQKSAS